MVTVIFSVLILGLLVWLSNGALKAEKVRQEDIRADQEALRRDLAKQYGTLSQEEIAFHQEIDHEDKIYLLEAVHGLTNGQASTVLFKAHMAVKKIKRQQELRERKLADRKIMQKAEELYGTLSKAARRQPIPEDVKLFVWQRDGGKCVKCGRQERLEFDHIIPFAKGGSDTARNLQLLCEACNRSKSANI